MRWLKTTLIGFQISCKTSPGQIQIHAWLAENVVNDCYSVLKITKTAQGRSRTTRICLETSWVFIFACVSVFLCSFSFCLFILIIKIILCSSSQHRNNFFNVVLKLFKILLFSVVVYCKVKFWCYCTFAALCNYVSNCINNNKTDNKCCVIYLMVKIWTQPSINKKRAGMLNSYILLEIQCRFWHVMIFF